MATTPKKSKEDEKNEVLVFGQPVFAIPTEGTKVRKSDGDHLLATGETVIHSVYYAKRFKDGDITLTHKLPEEPKAPTQ